MKKRKRKLFRIDDYNNDDDGYFFFYKYHQKNIQSVQSLYILSFLEYIYI